MLRKINELRNQKGSMMVEAIAMLGLISMVTPVIYKKAAERTNEMQDINAASQVRTMVNAIDDYLRDNYVTITSGGTVTSNSASSDQSVNYGDYDFGASDADTSVKTTAPINIEHFRDYLPLGFNAQGKIFDDFKVVIKQTRDPSGQRKALTTVMVANPNSSNPDLSRIRSSRIASMIGTNGGYFDGEKATGVQGVWEIQKDDLPNGDSIKDGSIVATSLEAVADGIDGGRKVLHRIEIPGRPELNAMETTLSMGDHAIDQIVDLIASDNTNTINVKGVSGTNATLHVEGDGIIDSTLKAAEENFIAETGYVQHKQALYVGDGDSESSVPFSVNGSNGSIKALSGKFNVNFDGNLPNIKLTGNNNKNVLDADENTVSFMGGNFEIYPTGDTQIMGYANIYGKLAAANGSLTVDENEAHFYDETLNVLKSTRDVNIGTEENNANLRVYGNTTIDNLNVEKNFKAGKIQNTTKYGFNVEEGTGNVTINSDVIAISPSGDRIFDIGATTADTTIAKKFIAGRYDPSRGGIGLAADETGATVRFGDANDSSFLVKDTKSNNQIEAKEGYTTFRSNGLDIANFFTNNSDNPQAKFSSDVSVYDGSQKLNILTVSADNSDGSSLDNGRGSIHMRKGVIELDRNSSETDNQTNPISYVKADRFISNVSDTSADATNSGGYSFEVNPAYTSMMNDIKLASRGGARLSDILPDFINKGIYVLDNTYTGNTNWESGSIGNGLILNGLNECPSDSNNCDTSAWMGFVPTPNCPPGYMQVATITPIRFAMAQAGIPVPVNDASQERTLQYRTDPRGDNISYGTGTTSNYKKNTSTLVIVSENTEYGYSVDGTYKGKPPYWAEIFNTPYTFQINTWLNTTLKAYYSDGKFKGWHGVMGFIYPAVYYQSYAQAIGKISGTPSSSDVIWNLFPVRKEELSAIATIYCYFDRTNSMFSDTYVDRYLPHNQSIGGIRHHEKSGGPNYNDPNLNYDSKVW